MHCLFPLIDMKYASAYFSLPVASLIVPIVDVIEIDYIRYLQFSYLHFVLAMNGLLPAGRNPHAKGLQCLALSGKVPGQDSYT